MENTQWLTVEEAATYCDLKPKYIENKISKKEMQSKIEDGIKYVLVSPEHKRKRAGTTQESYLRLKEECDLLKNTIARLEEENALKDTVIRNHATAMESMERLYKAECDRLNNELGTHGRALKSIRETKQKNVLARVLHAMADAIG